MGTSKLKTLLLDWIIDISAKFIFFVYVINPLISVWK